MTEKEIMEMEKNITNIQNKSKMIGELLSEKRKAVQGLYADVIKYQSSILLEKNLDIFQIGDLSEQREKYLNILVLLDAAVALLNDFEDEFDKYTYDCRKEYLSAVDAFVTENQGLEITHKRLQDYMAARQVAL